MEYLKRYPQVQLLKKSTGFSLALALSIFFDMSISIVHEKKFFAFSTKV